MCYEDEEDRPMMQKVKFATRQLRETKLHAIARLISELPYKEMLEFSSAIHGAYSDESQAKRLVEFAEKTLNPQPTPVEPLEQIRSILNQNQTVAAE